jgi:hypothetical protein
MVKWLKKPPPASVFILYQCQYQAPKAPSGYFELGVPLRRRFERFQEASAKVFANIIAAINTHVARESKSNE